MNYAKIDKNDITNGEGVCVSLWVSGCPIHCPECHNESLWDFDGGQPFTTETLQEILDAISANGIQRNFSILGGEPLAPQNRDAVEKIVSRVRDEYPDIKIYLWTGYKKEDLAVYAQELFSGMRHSLRTGERLAQSALTISSILSNINYLIDGPYIAAERDITLKLRGSRNQRIWGKDPEGKWQIIE